MPNDLFYFKNFVSLRKRKYRQSSSINRMPLISGQKKGATLRTLGATSENVGYVLESGEKVSRGFGPIKSLA